MGILNSFSHARSIGHLSRGQRALPNVYAPLVSPELGDAVTYWNTESDEDPPHVCDEFPLHVTLHDPSSSRE